MAVITNARTASLNSFPSSGNERILHQPSQSRSTSMSDPRGILASQNHFIAEHSEGKRGPLRLMRLGGQDLRRDEPAQTGQGATTWRGSSSRGENHRLPSLSGGSSMIWGRSGLRHSGEKGAQRWPQCWCLAPVLLNTATSRMAAIGQPQRRVGFIKHFGG